MWLKFVKDTSDHRRGDVVWADNSPEVQTQVNSGAAVRCLGPDGEIFEDSPPEKIISQLAQEDGLKFADEEWLLQQLHGSLDHKNRQRSSLGQYFDDEEFVDRKLKKLKNKP